MLQIINCECGESSMLNGRCIGCKRVRPSTNEVFKQIGKLREQEIRLMEQLELAMKLMIEDEKENQ